MPRPALRSTGIAKCASRFPRFTVSNAPPPELLNGGVPVVTWADAMLVARTAIKRKYLEERFMFSCSFALRFRPAQLIAKIERDKPVLKEAPDSTASTIKFPCRYF